MIGAPKAGEVKMDLSHPLVIYSRFDLNGMLLERAERAGAAIEKTRVLEYRAARPRLASAHPSRRRRSRFLHRRHGRAQSAARGRHASGAPRDTMSALGYYVPASQERIDIQFLPQPGRLHLGVSALRPSFGGHLRQGRAGAIAARAPGNLHGRARHLAQRRDFLQPHAAVARIAGWRKNRVAGDGWMAVGDAAGLVDPITGEGLYYAMRSGDLASRVVLDDAHGIARKGGRVPRRVWRASSRMIWNSRPCSPSACSWATSCSAPCPRAWSSSCAAARVSAS